jgi:hypothetical protein
MRKSVSSGFQIHNGLKIWDAVSSMVSNFGVEYAMMNAQENQTARIKWLKSGTCVC